MSSETISESAKEKIENTEWTIHLSTDGETYALHVVSEYGDESLTRGEFTFRDLGHALGKAEEIQESLGPVPILLFGFR